MKEVYNIGLDTGTSSVGYAMTDEKGRLLRFHKRPTYGSVLFEEAQTAKERRQKRSARRRLARQRKRIKLLQALVAPDVCAADPAFFLRMNESFLWAEDSKYEKFYAKLPKALFVDGTVSVETLPTIYHIRNELVKSTKQADIRYVYLAMHHIIKYRGHFLMEGQTLSDIGAEAPQKMQELLELLTDPESFVCGLAPAENAAKEICHTMENHSLRGMARKEQIQKLLYAGKKKESKEAAQSLASLLLGYKGSLKALIDYENQTDAPEKTSLGAIEGETEETYLAGMTEAQAEVFTRILELYRWQLFAEIRQNGQTISDMMVARYEKHKADLKRLKKWIRTYRKDEYVTLFRDDNDPSGYAAYTHHLTSPARFQQEKFTRCRQEGAKIKSIPEGFYNKCRRILESKKIDLPENARAEANEMLEEMKADNVFLPLQRINLNGQIPNQIQAEELAKILDAQGKYYPTLRENREKILSICTFRLPYYVGPLYQDKNSPFQKWIVRDMTQPAYPWNFFDVVNQTATAEGFIANLTNKCTYLPIEDVLPLHSLLYEEYLMLNELNRVRVKGNLIRDVQLKQRMLDELFAKNKSVSYKTFAKWLQLNSPYVDVTENDISGTQEPGKFTASLRTRYDLEKHGFTVNDQTTEQLETLVRWSTIFEDRSILKKLIQEKYPNVTDSQLSFLVQRRYTGWGRLSEKLLTGVLGEYENQPATIMEVLRATNENFMQVLNNPQYRFQEKIAKERLIELGEPKAEIDYDEIRKLQVSPALKRGIWTAVRIVKELIEHQGCHPHAIYLENTREETPDEKKQRTQSRLNQVEQMYKELAEDKTAEKVPSECWEVLKNCRDKKKLDDQQYLYLLQLGKSLYSGKPLDFDQLSATTQIDHILPQCYIVDNSIENRALVLSGENQRKADNLLLADSIRDSQRPWWNYLRQKGFMGEKKFKNLTRSVVSEEDKQKFIARQLVETGQMVQCVTELFKRYYPDVHVSGIKAGLSSELREQYGLYKIRELNDMHHAYDAFLAATMGNFVERFMPWLDNESSAAIRFRKAQGAKKDDDKVDLSSKHGMILARFSRDQVDADTGEIIRNAQQDICYLKAVWGYHDGHVVFLKRQKSGKITEASRYRAGHASAKLPLKKGMSCQRYGGFDSIKPAYIAAISYQKGKQRAGALVNVPIYLAEAIEKNPKVLVDYLEKDYPGVQIIRSKILIRQKIEYEGNELTLGSCTETYNAKELFLPTFLHPILAKIYNASCALTDADENQLNTLIDVLLEKLSSQYPIYSGALKALEAKKSEILSLSIADKGKFIAETMKITSAGKEYAKYSTSLPKLGIADKGRLNNKLPHPEKIILIDQSITGLREKRTKLWPDSEPS
jgi:CRISPR-associated endonuclease Csn1